MRVILLSILLVPLSCAFTLPQQRAKRIPYELNRPTTVLELPAQLVEISALTDVDSTTVACVQDESSTLYFIGLKDGRVLRTETFGGPADMEGLTRVGSGYFALRSDGLIHHIEQVRGRWVTQDTFRLDIPNRNIEGLGYDDRSGLVLVSPKDITKGGPEVRDDRILYAFDPKDPAHSCRPVLKLSVDALTRQAEAKGIAVPTRTTDKGRTVSALKLRYSSVAVHPATGHYYLLSAVDRMLLVVDRAGLLVDLAVLDAELLPKPEGITFLSNGDLVLSSEGKGRVPVIARYASVPAR
ncbi:MAG: SdiA-regulated domain-containing protein [Flavobacteriales bacterium]|nr:SdiA-regulated domain-containing protein [Flavobacteriales bacterium]